MKSLMQSWKRVRNTLGAITLLIMEIVGVSLAAVGTGAGETYPSRVIKFVVPLVAGGPPDVMARVIAPAMSERLGQPVVVENRAGGGGTIGTKQVATAGADGYTLLFIGANHTLAPALSKSLGYDPVNDFAPIATVGAGSWVLVVAPSVPAKSVKEFVAYAKSNPGKLNWGFPSNTGPHLFGEMFRVATGIDVARIPYKGGPSVIPDMLGGRIHMAFNTTGALLPLIREGKLRALAVTSDMRSADLPDVPTMAESGLPRLTRGFWTGLLAPAGTPTGIVNRLNAAIGASLATPDVKAGLAKLGYEPKAGSPQDFATLLAEEVEAWKEAARAAEIVPQ